MEYRSPREGAGQRLDKGEKKDQRLGKPAAPLDTRGPRITGVAVERGDKANANVTWKMCTDQLDHSRDATLHTQRRPHACYMYRLRQFIFLST